MCVREKELSGVLVSCFHLKLSFPKKKACALLSKHSNLQVQSTSNLQDDLFKV